MKLYYLNFIKCDLNEFLRDLKKQEDRKKLRKISKQKIYLPHKGFTRFNP